MSGEIHHGHQGAHAHGHGAWQANPLPGGVPPGAPGEAGPVKHGQHAAKAHQQAVDLQKDVQTSAQLTETKSKDQAHSIASGFRYATLSQSQLDGADPTQPRVTDARLRAATGSLPGGPGGTGNPFFKPNPMVAFFTSFMTLLQVMKWLEKVATKLTVIQMQGVKDTGLAQAEATLNAGKAQAAADRAQGVLTALQAAFTFGQLAGSLHTDVRMGKKGEETAMKEEESARDIEKKAVHEDGSAREAAQKYKAKHDFANNVLENKPIVKVGKREDLEKIRDPHARKAEAAKERGAAEQDYKVKMDAYQKHSIEANMGANYKNSKAYQAQVTEHNQLHKDVETAKKRHEEAIYNDEVAGFESGLPHGAANDTAAQKLEARKQYAQNIREEANKEKANVNKLQDKANSSKLEAKNAMKNANEYRFSGTNLKAWERRANLKQQDKWQQTYQMGGQAINYVLEAIKHFFKATGEEQSAYYQSFGQIMATYNQMIKTGLDSTTQMNRDAYQQGGDLSQTLIKMSDQESQSMHWAA